MLFLTDLDPRARVKGSRDALGAQAVWAAAGRPLVGNLTTVTASVPAFTTLLVGLRLAERAAAEGKAESVEDAFLAWEQMAAYARHVVHQDRGFFGFQRVASRAANVAGGGGKVMLSARADRQILGNQKTDGLLGNYTSPARTSGLVAAGFPARLTAEAAAFVDETYVPRLAKGWGRDARVLVQALGQEQVAFELRPNPKLDAVASVFSRRLTKPETVFYRHHLVEGGPHDPTGGRQARLAAVLAPRLREADPLSQPLVARLAGDADGRSWGDVADLLRRVAACESVLAPASVLFSYLLTRDEAGVDEVVHDVRSLWGERLGCVHPTARLVLSNQHWQDIASALDEGDYRRLIASMAERNAVVMRERGAALPWLEITDKDRLRVRFRDEPVDLPDAATVRGLWRFPYFLPSLRAVLATVQEGRS